MATMAVESPNGSGASAASASASASTPQRLPMPSRNPLPLSASQEAQVREIFHNRVRNQCAAEIKGMLGSLLLPSLPHPVLVRFPRSKMESPNKLTHFF